MKKFFIAFFIFVNQLFSQENIFSGKNAWLYDSVLCSPKFEGRKTGLLPATEAAKWIANKFNEWGISPGGKNNLFLQEFSMLVTEEMDVPKLIIKNAQRGVLELREGEDFILFTNSGSGKIESDVIFVGYGLSEPDWGWDDYKDIDVKGKIVLLLDGAPENTKYNWDDKNNRNYKFKTASKKGAAGFIMWRPPANNTIRGAAIIEENYDKNLSGVYILDWVMREFFKETQITFDEIKEILKKKTFSFNTGKKVLFEVKMKEIKPGKGENVIGMIPGTDPKFKDEYIIFGAHMDHCGKSSVGYIYPGADDNGSGTVVVMELARALKNSGIKSKRSILFMGFGGEEQGLLGSNYFVDNPTIPKEKIALMINLDMVGVGDGGLGIGGIESFRKYWDEFIDVQPQNIKEKIFAWRAGLGGSDYTGFKIAGVPAFNCGSTGPHKFYHVVDDKYSYVKPEVMQNVGDILFRWAKFLSEYPNTLLTKYRNEKSLLASCSMTDLNFSNDVKINNSDFSFAKTLLENNIKFINYNLLNLDKQKNYENLFNIINKYFDLQKTKSDYIQFSLNGKEAKGAVNGSRLVVLPVVTGITKDDVLLNILNKIGIKYFRINANDYSKKDIEDFAKKIKNLGGTLEIISKDLKETYSSSFININYSDIKSENISNDKKYIINIFDNKFNYKNLFEIILKAGKENIHLNISEINQEQEYICEFVKFLKDKKFTDEDIRNIFGNNYNRGL